MSSQSTLVAPATVHVPHEEPSGSRQNRIGGWSESLWVHSRPESRRDATRPLLSVTSGSAIWPRSRAGPKASRGDDDAAAVPGSVADVEAQILELWDRRADLSPADTEAVAVVHQVIDLLDRGEVRAAEIDGTTGEVVVHAWLKQAILLLFRLSEMQTIEMGPFEFA